MTSSRARRSTRRLGTTAAGFLAVALAMTACAGGSGTSGSGASGGAGDGKFSFLVNTENTTIPAVLKSLSTGACEAENSKAALTVQTVPQTQLDQKLQLLAGQNALPNQFAAGNAPTLTKQLAQGGQIQDLTKALTDEGVLDQLEPAAVSTIKSLYGGLNVLPYQYNIEGIWYNKKLFADNGIAVPDSFTELTSAAAKLEQAGVTPFAASGEQGWPITRLISGYLFRELGPSAMQDVADGKAKLTDPEYVKAAQQIADWGKAGYFGKGVSSIDYDTAFNQFLTGKAGMFYMGSWALANFADKSQNKIGSDNIGFMPVPNVTGGSGSSDQTPSNVGLPMAIGAKSYSTTTGAWLKCIANNYGAESLKSQNAISGFKVNGTVDTDALTKSVQDRISSTKTSVLWFEAFFSSKATTASQTNAAQLASGSMSAQQVMQTVQSAL